jgi:hypothetical protein
MQQPVGHRPQQQPVGHRVAAPTYHQQLRLAFPGHPLQLLGRVASTNLEAPARGAAGKRLAGLVRGALLGSLLVSLQLTHVQVLLGAWEGGRADMDHGQLGAGLLGQPAGKPRRLQAGIGGIHPHHDLPHPLTPRSPPGLCPACRPAS